MNKAISKRYVEHLSRNSIVYILVLACIALFLAYGTTKLSFRTDARVFFSDQNPELLKLHQFEARFGQSETIVFVVSVDEGTLFTTERLNAINELTDQAWQLEHVKRVDSVTNFQRVSSSPDDSISIDHLARSGDNLTAGQAEKLASAATGEPLLIGRLLSHDLKTGLVAVKYRLPKDGSIAPEQLMRSARETANQFTQAHGDLKVGLTGSIALDAAFSQAAGQDGSTLMPIMISLILVLLWILMRSIWIVLASAVVIGISIITALGIAGYLGIPLSPPSVASPNIIMILATADCVHLFNMVTRKTGCKGGRLSLISEGLAKTFRPIALTSVATAIGFFSLCFSESPPFRHLGIISGAGALTAWFFTVTLIPIFLMYLPWKHRRTNRLVEIYCHLCAKIVIARPKSIMIICLIVAAALASLAPINKLDDRYVRYFDERFEFRQDTDFFNQQIGGFYELEYALNSGEPDGINDPEYLRQVDRLSNWFEQQSEVTHVAAYPDIVKQINLAFHNSDPAQYRIPDDQLIAAQYLLLYEMSLPFGLDLKESISIDKSVSRMTVLLKDLSTGQILNLAARASQWAEIHAPLIAGSTQATGMSVLFSHIGMRNIREMLSGTLVAVALISALLFLLFRSTLLGSLALLANVSPAFIALGGWALLVGEVGMAVATIAAMTLGIVVDDTIHLIDGFRKSDAEGIVEGGRAVRHVLTETGPGIVVTTIILAAGFFCLSFSGFEINAWMGLMTAVVMLVALVFDMLLLPAAMLVFKYKRPDNRART